MAGGRPPLGPKLVDTLQGTPYARARLRAVLETVAGQLPIREACSRLGIEPAQFHKIRGQALQAALERLEPRSPGRPRKVTPSESERVDELEREVDRLRVELLGAQTRAELAVAGASPAGRRPKKGALSRRTLRRRSRLRARRG